MNQVKVYFVSRSFAIPTFSRTVEILLCQVFIQPDGPSATYLWFYYFLFHFFIFFLFFILLLFYMNYCFARFSFNLMVHLPPNFGSIAQLELTTMSPTGGDFGDHCLMIFQLTFWHFDILTFWSPFSFWFNTMVITMVFTRTVPIFLSGESPLQIVHNSYTLFTPTFQYFYTDISAISMTFATLVFQVGRPYKFSTLAFWTCLALSKTWQWPQPWQTLVDLFKYSNIFKYLYYIL